MPEALFVSGGPYESRTRHKRIHDALLTGFDTVPTVFFADDNAPWYTFPRFDGMTYFYLFILRELE
jgi:hypothetical protein